MMRRSWGFGDRILFFKSSLINGQLLMNIISQRETTFHQLTSLVNVMSHLLKLSVSWASLKWLQCPTRADALWSCMDFSCSQSQVFWPHKKLQLWFVGTLLSWESSAAQDCRVCRLLSWIQPKAQGRAGGGQDGSPSPAVISITVRICFY